MAQNAPDEDKVSSHKMLWTLLLAVLGLQVYIATRPTAPVVKPSQGPLQTQVAPALPATNQPTGSRTGDWQGSAAQTQGKVQKSTDVDILPMTFKVSGRVTKLYVQQNAEVKQGDALATLDPAPFEKSVADARVRLKVARDQLENLHHLPNPNFQGVERARAHIEAVQHDYDNAKAALLDHKKVLGNARTDNVDQDNIQNEHDAKLVLEKARRELAQQEALGISRLDLSGYEAAVQIARNSLDEAEYDLEHAKMLAPSDGTIASVNVESGAIVPSGTAVFTMAVPR